MRDWIDKFAYNNRLTHLLLVIWCTIGSSTKYQNWVLSLTSCRLWDKAADHKRKHYLQTVVMIHYVRSMIMQCLIPTDINIVSDAPPRILWLLTCGSLSCSLAIWRRTNLFSCEGIQASPTTWWTFVSTYHSIWRPPTFLLIYCKLNFPMPMCSLTKMHTQKCGNFAKTMTMTSSHVLFLCFRTCLNNVNVSKWDFEYDPHWSADLTQRSRLFICIETNSWCILSSSIASAVFWVNSAQFFCGKSMSMKQHYSCLSGRNPHHSHLPIAHMPWEDI